MNSSDILSLETTLKNTTDALAQPLPIEANITPCGAGLFPSVESLNVIIDTIRSVFFPDFFDRQRSNDFLRRNFIGVNLEQLHSLMRTEVSRALRFKGVCQESDANEQAEGYVLRFLAGLPEIKRMLYSDVEAVFRNDPAVSDFGEIVLCYPGFRAMLNYRVAHLLLTLGIPALPRMLTEIAHSLTGIDINPGARIGEYFAIDHGTGIVIGETCIIGNHCTIYQGVTLGAKNFTFDDSGRPMNIARHPILEDNVTVYSNATILGRITVGHDSVIGGNVWLTTSVPPGSRIVQRRAD